MDIENKNLFYKQKYFPSIVVIGLMIIKKKAYTCNLGFFAVGYSINTLKFKYTINQIHGDIIK